MFKILEAQQVGFNIKQLVIEAPRIARKQRPGQFVILRVHEHGERIPLTLKASDPAAGTVTLAVQKLGKTSALLNLLEAGDYIQDIVGPLGRPSEIENYGTCVILAGGVGTAMALPTAKALREVGNHVVFIEGARNHDLVVFEDEVRSTANETYFMTDDGSYGEQGLVTKKLNDLLASERKIDFVLAVGPVPMMRAVAEVTRPQGIKTMVSLNSIMVDGTGMCGGCRVVLDGKTSFACVDGPEFDAARVDFDILRQRNAIYREKECQSLKHFEENQEEELKQIRAAASAQLVREETHHAR